MERPYGVPAATHVGGSRLAGITATGTRAPMTAVAQPSVYLLPISAQSGEAVLAGRPKFSAGIAGQVGGGSPLGPFFIHRTGDDVVVGEIGGGPVAPGTAENRHAIAPGAPPP